MDASAQTAPPLLSPDGHWRWDGAQWVPAIMQVPGWTTPAVTQPYAQPYAYPARGRDGLAVASLVCSIVGLGFGSIAAIVLATKSRRRARRERREPSGMALAGLILGCVGTTLFVVGILAALAIPTFLQQRQAAHVQTVLQRAAAVEEAAAVTGGYVSTEELLAYGLRVEPQVEVAVLRYSATSYCLGAKEGGTIRYYSPATGVTRTPC